MNKVHESYQERLVEEYKILKKKYDNLHRFIVRHEAGTLGFEIAYPIDLLKRQAKAMGEYLYILEVRAEIEDIDLDGEEA